MIRKEGNGWKKIESKGAGEVKQDFSVSDLIDLLIKKGVLTPDDLE